MNTPEKAPALLVLEDGTVFRGKSIGAKGTVGGEICFNTGMTGYQEIYTDPSYYGQIIINTTPHIGNYGVTDTEDESGRIQFSGLVCSEYSQVFSRANATGSLQEYLEAGGIPGITELDTRALVRHIRSKGAMNAMISSEILSEEELKQALKRVPSMLNLELASQVSTAQPYFYGNEQATTKVAVLDLGIKKNILRNFERRNVLCRVFPAQTPYSEMAQWEPDGFFLSNGPGDPASTDYAIETTKDILRDDQPLFGICLGIQVMALAVGIGTYKMHHGHRGLNHPVKNLLTGRGEMTSQNHGFAVAMDDLQNSPEAELTHRHLNDGTVAGMRLRGKKAMAVQYHPEASPGPHDSHYLFDEFLQLIRS